MSMLTLNGTVMNTLQVPERKNREGESYGGYDQVQIMAEQVLQNGEKRMELLTLRTEQRDVFERLKGRAISCPVGVFAVGGQLRYFLPPNGAVVPFEASSRPAGGSQ